MCACVRRPTSFLGSLLQVLQALSTYKLSEEQAADPELDVLTGVLPALAAHTPISSSCSCALTGCSAPDGAPVVAACEFAGQLLIQLCPDRLCLRGAALLLCLLVSAGICLWTAD